MSPGEFLVPAGRPILSSTASWIRDYRPIISGLDHGGLAKLGLICVGDSISVDA